MQISGKISILLSSIAMLAGSASAQDQPSFRLGENSPLTPPFCETFDNFRKGMEHDDFPRYFQTIDSNDDGRSWGLYNYSAVPYGRSAYMLFPLEGVKSADDWLISRAVKLEKGKYYCISMDAALYLEDSGSTPQVFEVKVGTYNDADGLKTTVIPATSIKSKTFTHVYGWFKPDFTAKYYIGIHGISPLYYNYYNYLFIDNISVEAPKDGGAPSGVTDLKMANDPRGTNAVEISFAAPTKSLDGSALTSLTSITVAREGKQIKTISNPTPGKKYTFTDTPDSISTYNYTITSANSAGEGETVHMSHACGISAPLPPVITSFKDAGDGEVTVTWTAPTEDVNGNPIDPEIVSYTIIDYSDGEANPVGNDISETELTYALSIPEGEQKMALCTVSAEINGKMSEATGTNVIAVGTPYTLPYHNSFTLDDYYKYVMSIDVVDDVTWRMLDDYSDPDAQDGDNGYVCMIGNQPDQQCTLWSGKIDLDAKRPTLTFYTYVYGEDQNLINIKVLDCATDQIVTAESISLYQFRSVGWHKVRCSLADFAGKTVCIGLEGYINTHGYIPVDNFLIEDMSEVELEVTRVSYPRQAEADQEFTIDVTVGNNGYATAENYSVTLLAGDREVTTVSGSAIASTETAVVSLTDKFSAISPASTDYTVRVNAKGDAKPENNVSDPFTIVFAAPNLPTVTDLSISEEGQTLNLTWSAPDVTSAAPDAVTEDFESYEGFATEFGAWKTVDEDGGLAAGFQDLDMPIQGEPQSFWVMNATGSFSFVPTHSGSKSIAAMYALTSNNMAVKSDDWLISPELYGGAQTINFWACSLTEEYGLEQFEVWYSTTGNNTLNFKQLTGVTEAPEEWTNYFVALPEGTKYFAIHYVSDDRCMFLLDDITYIPAGTPRKLELKGYNVYNGTQKLNSAMLTSTNFTTPRKPEGGEFFVTAVYDLGESTGSNVVSVVNVGLDAIYTDADDNGEVELYDLRGIRVNPAKAAPGIYLRRTASGTSKTIIR